jgi:prepilin-type N-terminal cleavage/methylation domain-containing protein
MINQNPSPTRSQAERHGFTLIELLVVISIIAVLAGLAFPAVNGAMDSARKARAKSDVTQIATAIVAYETEYGRLPVAGTNDISTNVSTNLVKILIGADTNANPRNIVFLEVSVWKKGKGGTNASGFCDPWDTNSVYQIAFDANYDNRITNAGNPATNIMKKVAVWSTNSVTNRRVTSW